MIQIDAHHQDALLGKTLHQISHHIIFDWVGTGVAVALVIGKRRVVNTILGRQLQAHLQTMRRSEVTSALQVFPRRVIAFGPNQTKDITLPTVLSNESRGESKSSGRLQFGA